MIGTGYRTGYRVGRWCAALLLAGGALPLQAAPPLRIAVMPFNDSGQPDVAKIIENDLIGSGGFRALRRAEVERLRQTHAAAGGGDESPLLRQAGASHVIYGELFEDHLQLKIWDAGAQKKLLDAVLPYEEPGQLRYAAHQAADLVHQELLGVPGYFSSRIAFIEQASEKGTLLYRLVITDADGENARVVTQSPEPLLSPAWSPDRQHIAYVAYEKGRSVILIQSLDSGETRKLVAEKGINGAPAWSPDGDHLAVSLSVSGNPDLYVIDLRTGLRRQLTDHPAIDTEPSWSPDGQTIAYTSNAGGQPQLYLVSSEGGEARQLALPGAQNYRAAFSPDGERLALVNSDGEGYRIGVLELRSGQLRLLTDGPMDETPGWAPNGRSLCYVAQTADGGTELQITTLDAKLRQRLSGRKAVRDAAWSPLPPR